MTPSAVVLWGMLGGLLPDLIRLAKSRHEFDWPGFLARPGFWVGLLALVIIGGVAALLGSANQIREAVIFGFAGPEVISRLAAERGATVGREVADTRFSVRAWWAR
jgi:hypothetical protein